MMFRNWLVVGVMILSVSGCVWKSEYTAKLTEIDGLQKTNAGLEEKNKNSEKELVDLKKKYEELTAQKEQLEKEKAALESEKANLQNEKANLQSTLETKRDQLSREVVELKNRLSENNNRIQNLDQELAARSKHINELKELVDQLTLEKTRAIEEKDQAVARVKGTYDSLVSELKQEIKEGEIQITQLKDKLTVNLVEKILFDSGSAVIKRNGKKVLDRVAEILKTVAKQQIRVEGHTDNVPIGPGLADRFPTNWELATARATTVVRYLQERGVNPTFLSADGYSEYRPVAPNDTDEGKSRNRRIEIVLIPIETAM